MSITVNGTDVPLPDDPRVSLLDHLRETLHLTGTKKGCNQGACGACTVLAGGERILSCLALAVQYAGQEIKTIEGIGTTTELHKLQQAFVEHDGFQCGYCTPGQICSAMAMVTEARAGMPSHVSGDLLADRYALSHDELRERMSGNLCRCGTYLRIRQAIHQATKLRDEPGAKKLSRPGKVNPPNEGFKVASGNPGIAPEQMENVTGGAE